MTIELIDNLVRNVREHGLEAVAQRYYGSYRAKVMDNTDDEHRGRIKVTVPNLFGENITLPNYAEPMDARGAGPGKGEFNPPEIDDWVFVQFEMGDARYPIYMGGWHAKEELKTDEFTHTDDKPVARGFMNKYGHVFKFSEEEGKEKFYLSTPAGHFLVLDDTADAEGIFLIHKSGAQLQIDKDGSAKFVSKDGNMLNLDAVQGLANMASKDGATVVLDANATLMDSTGAASLLLSADTAQLATKKDLVLQGNTATLSGGSVTCDAITASMKLGAGKIAIGAAGTELVDQVIQTIDALLQAPTLAVTAVGPTGPLTPPAQIQLTLIKILLTVIKGSL